MFEQNVKDFFKSKTNWLGLTAVIGGSVGYMTGEISAAVAVQGVMGGLMAIFLKDAIAK